MSIPSIRIAALNTCAPVTLLKCPHVWVELGYYGGLISYQCVRCRHPCFGPMKICGGLAA